MKVLIIPEDFRNDQYILKPLFSRLFHDIGKPRTKVEVCCDPLLGGVDEAMKIQRIEEILMQHGGMTDIFILCIDRDGDKNRRQKLDRLESKFRQLPFIPCRERLGRIGDLGSGGSGFAQRMAVVRRS